MPLTMLTNSYQIPTDCDQLRLDGFSWNSAEASSGGRANNMVSELLFSERKRLIVLLIKIQHNIINKRADFIRVKRGLHTPLKSVTPC